MSRFFLFQNQGTNGIPVYRVDLLTSGFIEVSEDSSGGAPIITGWKFPGDYYVGVSDGFLQVTTTPISGAIVRDNTSFLYVIDGTLYYNSIKLSKITLMGREGELRLYDGSTPPKYLSIPFVQMNFSSMPARPRPTDPIVETVDGYAHLPDAAYEEEFFQPTPVSFSCLIEDTTNSWKLRDALGNIDLHSTWTVGSQTWVTTKGQGSVNLADNSWSTPQDFFDEMMSAVDIEMLWRNPHPDANDTFGLQVKEIAFYPQDQTINEAIDGVELQVQGLCYGQISAIRVFTTGTES